MPERTCKVCGCTDTAPCNEAGIPCHWVGPELCSKCAKVVGHITGTVTDGATLLDAALAAVLRNGPVDVLFPDGTVLTITPGKRTPVMRGARAPYVIVDEISSLPDTAP